MTGAITNIESLRRWFFGNNMPFFSVKYQGQGEKIIYRNEVHEDLETAWEELKHQVESQAEAGRAMLEVLVFQRGKANHPIRTNVDIRYGSSQQTGIAGPGNYMPAGIGSITEYVDLRIKMRDIERDNEDLRAQISNPINGIDRLMGYLENPNIAKLVGAAITGLFAKNNPLLATQMTAAMNGIPSEQQEPENEEQAQAMFAENINSAAEALGIDPLTMSAKLRNLIENNPDLAKSLIQ